MLVFFARRRRRILPFVLLCCLFTKCSAGEDYCARSRPVLKAIIIDTQTDTQCCSTGTTVNWGVRAQCLGCAGVWADVQELAGIEVLVVECTCPPQFEARDYGCVCSGRFNWWWNMKCAANATLNTHLPNGSLDSCPDSIASWNLVAGNVSSEDQLETTSGSCPGTDVPCSGALHNVSISTRQVDIDIRLAGVGNCAAVRRVIWTLPIEASLQCSNVDQFLGLTLLVPLSPPPLPYSLTPILYFFSRFLA